MCHVAAHAVVAGREGRALKSIGLGLFTLGLLLASAFTRAQAEPYTGGTAAGSTNY
jgi:hypothetical protein